MLWVPQKGVIRVEHNAGTVGSATPGTAVTTGAAASTKGNAVELITSTAFDAYWVTVIASNYGASTVTSAGALDILVGAVTEEVLIPNLLMGFCGGDQAVQNSTPKRWDFPLYIPAGTRIAAQAAGERLSTAFRVWIYLYGGDGYPKFRVGSKVTTYGIGTVPDGVPITPGASGAEGAWAEITASTSESHHALVPSFQVSADATVNIRTIAVDIGIGAVTEEEIGQSYWFFTQTAEQMSGPFPSMPVFQSIPLASRLVMRASNSGANDAAYNGCLHAVS